jgi:hypothetical protein
VPVTPGNVIRAVRDGQGAAPLAHRKAQHRMRPPHGELDANVSFEGFVVDTIVLAPRPFQGHREVRLAGRWRATSVPVAAQAPYLVDMHQPLALLAAYLLDPQSEDGFTTWNFFDAALAVGRPHPVLRFPVR